MKRKWEGLSVSELNQLLAQAEKQLQQLLVEGKSWEEVRDLRQCINGLSLAIQHLRFLRERLDERLIDLWLSKCPCCLLDLLGGSDAPTTDEP